MGCLKRSGPESASPEEIKTKQEDADRAMRELLDEEEKEAGAATAAPGKNRPGRTKCATGTSHK